MKNFLNNLFGKNYKNKPIISFEVLNLIANYLYDGEHDAVFKMKNFNDKVFFNQYNFPHSFNQDEIDSLGLQSAFCVLNLVHKKADIGLVTQELIDDEYECNFLHIQFYTEAIGEKKVLFSHELQNFLIFFCCDNDSDETNSFRILYSVNDAFDNYCKDLLKAKFIDSTELETKLGTNLVKQFEEVLVGFFEFHNLQLPKACNYISIESLLPEKVTIAHFEEFINLISRNELDDNLVKENAEICYSRYLEKLKFEDKKDNEDEFDQDYEYNFIFLDLIESWNSDWKFGPEDVTCFISEMINDEFIFDYPKDTFAHNLFPYIDKELKKRNLKLISFDAYGDNYLFFVVNSFDIDRIFYLANTIEIDLLKH